MEPCKEYEVQISKISRQCDDIARIQGFVTFLCKMRQGRWEDKPVLQDYEREQEKSSTD